MSRLFTGSWLLILLLSTAPLLAADRGSEPKSKAAQPTDQDYKALEQLRTFQARVIAIDPQARSLQLRIEYQKLEPKGQAASHPLQVRQQQIRRSGTPLQQALQMQRLLADLELKQAQALQNSFRLVNEHKDFDLKLADTAAVRTLKLPAEYDEKGFLRQYTAQELKQMKGPDPNVPGYALDLDKLKPGSVVRVTLGSSAAAGAARDVAPDDRHARVSRVVMIEEGADPPAKPDKKKK